MVHRLLPTMYNEQFFQLFESLAGDGELTPQEQEVLERTGEAMGIDGEKFMIYFEARLAERFERLRQQPGGEEQVLAIMQRYEKAMAALPNGAPAPVPAAGPEQRKEAGPEHHEEIGKCPACKETISGLTHVCPSCGLVIDADHDTHGSLEEMLEEQEQLLLQAKALARNKAEQSDLGLDYLLVPFLMICGGVWYFKFDGGGPLGFLISIVMYLGAFAMYLAQKRSYKARLATTATGQPLAAIQEKFEKNDRQITLYFGDDSRVGNVLHTLRQQLAAAVAATRAKRKRSGGRILVRLALFVPMLYVLTHLNDEPTTQVADPAALSAPAVAPPDERPVQIQQLLNDHKLPEARALLAQLPDSSAARPVLLAALYEASQNQRLDSLRRLLPTHQYAVVRRGLRNLWWNEADTANTAARSAFEARKRMLNAELPAKYRLEDGWLTATGSRQ
jgi:hypothetical protein